MDILWVDKYRPIYLKEISSHDFILNTIKNFIKSKNIPHLLFYGPPGTGKTTTALAISKELNKNYKMNTLELNASDDRGIQVVRNTILDFITSYSYTTDTYKFVILDESDSMTDDAQFALRKMIEENVENARFCFICNYINKIIPSIKSRCATFRFNYIPKNTIKEKLLLICEKENIKITDAGIDALININSGDMRRCINYLQFIGCSFNSTEIDESQIYVFMGKSNPKIMNKLCDILFENNKPLNICYREAKYLIDENETDIHDIIYYFNKYLIDNIDIIDEEKSKQIFKGLSNIEYYFSYDINPKIQFFAILSIIHDIKN